MKDLLTVAAAFTCLVGVMLIIALLTLKQFI